MPIFEFRCGRCAHEFEKLMTGGATPTCPKCGSRKAEKKFSVFGSKSGGKFTSSKGGGCTSCAKSSCSSCH
ncbi:MAG TPA: zinc ribbon domain-containing protein [Candidatus Methanoperedens sp.]|nr:zinc ribbon domain-containing protein [Candidatus Methanoperedens sp.]